MKIVEVECLILANEHPIVRVATDEGLVGWGECFRRARAVAKPAIEQLFRLRLVGQDPLEGGRRATPDRTASPAAGG